MGIHPPLRRQRLLVRALVLALGARVLGRRGLVGKAHRRATLGLRDVTAVQAVHMHRRMQAVGVEAQHHALTGMP